MSQYLPDYLYIDGERVTQFASTAPVLNPADESILGEAPVADSALTESAILAARAAFDGGAWSRISIEARVHVMQRFHDALQARKADIVGLIVAEAGSTQALADYLQFEIPMKHARTLMRDAALIRTEMSSFEVTPTHDGRQALGTAAVFYEPIGVVSAITAYNFPYFLNIVKVFHALLMGNTCILKPSPLTPFQALILADAAEEAGIPKGVLNIINGGVETGRLITSDRRVDLVTFTGSDKVGAAIAAQAAPSLKKTHLELGGKSAMILRADGDLQAAVLAGAASVSTHAGQGCALTTRHLIHNSLRPAYVAGIKQALSQVTIGNPADGDVNFGPLIRASARERSEYFVAQGLDGGARLVTGGRRPEHLEKGFFYEPTVFDDVDNKSYLAQNEAFGPIAAVIGFDTDEQAVAIANDSEFGLSGQIFSGDAGAAFEMAQQLRTGAVLINEGAGTMLSSAPFGGYKRSGHGREFGRMGLLSFCEAKSISFQAR